MRTHITLKACRGLGALCAVIILAASVGAAQSITIPEGTVIGIQMQDNLSSATSNVGDAFRATTVSSLSVNGGVAIPANSRVDGRVTVVQPAELGVRSGVLGVEFVRLTLPDNTSYTIDGALTSLTPDQNAQPTQLNLFRSGKKNFLIGGGNNSFIGAITAGALTRSSLLSSGTEAEVAAGANLNMQILRTFTVNTGGAYQGGNTVVYNSTSMIRAAQAALKNRNYYAGVLNGFLTQETRAALESFQSDNGLAATGQLDQSTASALGLVRVGQPGAVDPQFADSFYRQAQSLLGHYESALGVRVNDIRSGLTSSRVLTEGDLNLLLDVDSFAKAAYWYQQSIHSAPNSDASSVALRILSRGASRIQDDLQGAHTDQIFSQRWNTIQSDLNRLGGAQNASADYTWTTPGNPSGSPAQSSGYPAGSGHFHWQGIVDGLDNILVRGSTVSVVHLQSAPIQQGTYDMSNPLPYSEINVTLTKVRGRGNITLLEQPSAANNYTAVVQVDDQAIAGSAWYEFTLDW
ncbi:MAG TPA: peptidoglycan-binding domain-containing protein [Terriglobia bacterium]|nr:peptidoglycan-binding domain-containing protein [Terriglobia bacterium]